MIPEENMEVFMEFTLSDLPYSKEALEPHISRETLEYHHGKHHQAYVTKLNELIKSSEFEKSTLEEIVLASSGTVFNHAAQHWNHTFFWNCLSPEGGGNPSDKMLKLINDKWESFENFQEHFTKSAIANFGSGWTWIVQDEAEKLSIMNTSNAENPLCLGKKAILTLDIWEHAYYIDYRNSRPDFIKAFWNLANWDFADQNLNRDGFSYSSSSFSRPERGLQ